MINTARKILLAKIAFRIIMLFRLIFGKGYEVLANRGGVRWKLDLREGIDLSIFLLGRFEPTTYSTYERLIKPGYVILDIGANIGAHTLPMALLTGSSGSVIAFEPTNYAINKLLCNIDLNPTLANRIKVQQIMLAEDSKQIPPEEIFSSWPLTEERGLHEEHKGKLKHTDGAVCKSLDEVLFEIKIDNVDFIKLDVDGYEHNVIIGGFRTINRFRPKILMELAPYLYDERSGAFEKLIECFKILKYNMTEVNSGRALEMDAKALRDYIKPGASINVLAVPM